MIYFHCNVAQRTIGTGYLPWIIFDYYGNEYGKYLFTSQRVCMLYFGDKRENAVNLPHSAKKKIGFLVEIKEKDKSKKVAPKNKVVLKLLHHRLGHISTRSLMFEYTAKVWQDIELRIDTDPFFKSCQISSMNKNVRSKNLLEPKALFKWVYGHYSSSTPKRYDM